MKILVVLPRFPYPLEKGDKLRAYHQIVELSKRHEIYLFSVSHTKVTPEQRSALEPFCREIKVVTPTWFTSYFNVARNYFRSKSLQMGYWDSRRARRTVREMARRIKPDVVYNQMVRTVPFVARLPLPKVMDFQDSLSLNTERRMEQSSGLWRALLHYEFKMLRSTEYNAFKIFDALTIISEVDSEAIPHKKNGEIHLVPNGVDFDYFHSSVTPLSPWRGVGGEAFSICFCGNMSYAPNVDAARYLVREVMPLVWAQRPEATVLLAGADPKAAVRALASDKVTVSGRLDDIRQAYSAADIFVAPMRIGSGLQNKLLEAMSMQKPCVTTSLANAALGAAHGSQLLIGDSPQALADNILRLLDDHGLADRLAAEGNAFVHQHYSWEAAVQPLEKLFNELVESK
jgi:sugar transferase (PEP-CTERM/EpsH1 system associated)